MKILLPFLLVICIAVAGCAPSNVQSLLAKKSGSQLTPEQVLSLVEGNTLKLSGGDADMYLFLDTSGKTFAVDDDNSKDLGQWDVSEEGEFCVRMKHWWFGDLICYQVYSVDDGYTLTNTKGLILFSALQYAGDYKGSYYPLKRERKSIRKSARHKSDERTSLSRTRAREISEPVSQPETPVQAPEKSITEVNTYAASKEDRNLRSTVKWMARDCPGCNLAETDLKKADLVGASLAGANLRGSNLRMANLRRADLEGANLEDAILTYCKMPGANLKNANLRGANLKGANLIRADLTNADLTGATLEGALLEGVKGLSSTVQAP